MVLQGIASIAQACAALRHHPGELLDGIVADMEARPSEYERDDWTAIVWALTRLARPPGRLYARLAQEVSRSGLAVCSMKHLLFCLTAAEESVPGLLSCASAAQCLNDMRGGGLLERWSAAGSNDTLIGTSSLSLNPCLSAQAQRRHCESITDTLHSHAHSTLEVNVAAAWRAGPELCAHQPDPYID